ncbi:MAG: hypothetical protein F6K61_20315 [Sphaerospermopsis sp. SIO1G1]|nr:hypothetical protein [Sphaerospermopsis sp. SIO1G1]
MFTNSKIQKLASPSLLLLSISILIGIIGFFYLFWHENQTKLTIDVPKNELPAYYQIKPQDLAKKTYTTRTIPANTLKNPKDILGRYTLTNIPKHKPLTEKQLSPRIDPSFLAGTVTVGIPATPAMTFNGKLQAGDIVNITLVPAKSKVIPQNSSSLSLISFPNIIVLDVKSVLTGNTLATSVIIIALPKNRQSEFATHIPDATLLISRDLE